jgi:uncharacterized repeat protein (TIGR04138 family)
MKKRFETIIEEIYERDCRYKEDAYIFVMEALAYTQKKFKLAKHVRGENLLIGMREYLLDKYGPMTMTVLRHWGIKSTEDFGNIVFNLVENQVLSKTEDDNIEEFRNGYDFEEVFDSGYRKQLARKISRMRSI